MVSLLILSLLLLLSPLHGADEHRCSGCRTWISARERLCPRCLRATQWEALPARSRQATVIARTGRDAFIRSPNDQHPAMTAHRNSGLDRTGHLGSHYSLTGLRYLIWFDVPRAFAEAGRPMAGFKPEGAFLLLRTTPHGDARADVPVTAFPLRQIFAEGTGQWGRHRSDDGGCSWFMATGSLPWRNEGGDYHEHLRGFGRLPRQGAQTVVIDVTDIYVALFAALEETGIWNDPGLILMRDPQLPSRCTYREIYSFQARPGPTEEARWRRSWPSSPNADAFDMRVLSPELYIE